MAKIKLNFSGYTTTVIDKKEVKLMSKIRDIWNHVDDDGRRDIAFNAGEENVEAVSSSLKKGCITPGIAYGFMCYIGIQPETFFSGFPASLLAFNAIYVPLKAKASIPKLTKEEIQKKYFN